MKNIKKIILGLILFAGSFVIFACGSNSGGPAATGKTVKTGAVNNLTVTIATDDGVIKRGKTAFTVSFADTAGKPVDAGAVSLNFYMPSMGSMSAMNAPATLTTTGTPGVYRGAADLEMSGEWQVQIAYEGAAGKGKGTFPVTAQ